MVLLIRRKEPGTVKILGIVAEFNPFHNGHHYLITKTRQMVNADAIVCVMSGNFLQRGEPALCDKWTRTRMALCSGVDLVIELPFCCAARSAYYFARGALQLLHRSGIVTHLAFGSESGNLDLLQQLAAILSTEPPQFKTVLKDGLAQGMSFPAARARALQHTLPAADNLEDVLLAPNNILALEYLRVIQEYQLPIHPITITRAGAGYHDANLSPLASASSIRQALHHEGITPNLHRSLPASSTAILEEQIRAGRAPVAADGLEQAVLVNLRKSCPEELEKVHEITEGLEHRILEYALKCGTLEELRQSIKSKRYSLSRINRILLYSLLGVSKHQIQQFDQAGPSYLHILGFSAKGQEILQKIKIKSPLPLLNRGSEVKRSADLWKGTVKGEMLALDIMASDIYCLLLPNPAQRQGSQDYTTSPIKM